MKNSEKAVLGTWRIASMEIWDLDYFDMEAPAHITVCGDLTCEFPFGLVQGVQCKRYRSHISLQHLREVANVIRERGLAGGFFAHTGRPPLACRNLEDGVVIISGQGLINFLLRANNAATDS